MKCYPKTLNINSDTWDKMQRDMEIAKYWHEHDFDKLPVLYNYFLSPGYFIMPSACMAEAGEFGLGYSSVDPYRIYSFQAQIFNRLQGALVYRVFEGVKDVNLAVFGFGDYMDRGLNVKYNIVLPEDSNYLFPGLAYGMEDAWGSKKFRSIYLVATQVSRKINAEATIGWGNGRIQGFFGGLAWTPLRKSKYWFLNELTLAGEYDSTNYSSSTTEPHPQGRNQSSALNYGIKYRLGNFLESSVSSIRGEAVAWSVALNYNLGETEGLLPKYKAIKHYNAPVNYQSLGYSRSEENFIHELGYVLDKQGFDLLGAWISTDKKEKKVLRLELMNLKYFFQDKARKELTYVLSALLPQDISKIIVAMKIDGLVTQEYTYRSQDLMRFTHKQMGMDEIMILSSPKNATKIRASEYRQIYKHKQDWWVLDLHPSVKIFFGNKVGKVKTALVLNGGIEGYLFNEIFYNFKLTYVPYSDINQIQDYDYLNPSPLLNVNSDIVKYFQNNNFTISNLYIQKSWNLTKGFFGRLSAGYFQVNFGGFGAEALYYPIGSRLAFGIEGGLLKKRDYSGLSFQSKLREFQNKRAVYKGYNMLYQYSLNIYYDIEYLKTNFELNIGQFLARDMGFKLNFTRYFNSGLRLLFWIAFTNGKDYVNGARYFNSGAGITMPLDIFLHFHSRLSWGYSFVPWLRDSGIQSSTGQSLYSILSKERMHH